MRATFYERVRPPAWVVDVAIVFALAVPSLIQLPFVDGDGYARFSVLLLVPLLFRRTHPVLSFAAFTALCVVQLRIIDYPVWGDVGLFVALASIARYGPTWARWTGLLVGLAAAVLGPGRWTNAFTPRPFGTIRDLYPVMLAGAVVVGFWIFGDLRRTRANYIEELEDRARRLAVERDQQATIAAAAERQRIAREMHDVVAHSLSVIVVQADGGRFAATEDPGAATRTLETISSTGREALTEMRRLLGLLRTGEPSDQTAPQPGTADIDELVAAVEASGLEVDLSVVGSPAHVDQGTGLTVYRIVQEGLTNTIKHGGPAAKASVRVAYGTDEISVQVVDDGRGAAATSPVTNGSGPTVAGPDGDATTTIVSGHGLIGMRERVELHGGSLVARPAVGGGFEVRATLPRVGEPA